MILRDGNMKDRVIPPISVEQDLESTSVLWLAYASALIYLGTHRGALFARNVQAPQNLSLKRMKKE